MSDYCFENPGKSDCVCTDLSQQKIETTKTVLDNYCESKNTPNRYVPGTNYVCCGMINTREEFVGFANQQFCEDHSWVINKRAQALINFWTNVQTKWRQTTNGTNHARIQLYGGVLRGSCHAPANNNGQLTSSQQRRLYYANAYGAVGIFCKSSSSAFTTPYESSSNKPVSEGREPWYSHPNILDTVGGLYDLWDEYPNNGHKENKVRVLTSKQKYFSEFWNRLPSNQVARGIVLNNFSVGSYNQWAERPNPNTQLGFLRLDLNQKIRDEYPPGSGNSPEIVNINIKEAYPEYKPFYNYLLEDIETYEPDDTPPLPQTPPPPGDDTENGGNGGNGGDVPTPPDENGGESSILTSWWFYVAIIAAVAIVIAIIYFATRKSSKKSKKTSDVVRRSPDVSTSSGFFGRRT